MKFGQGVEEVDDGGDGVEDGEGVPVIIVVVVVVMRVMGCGTWRIVWRRASLTGRAACVLDGSGCGDCCGVLSSGCANDGADEW